MSLAVPLTHLTELATVEACLAADLAGRDAGWAAQPSGLPGWTRAQVVAHLAGNAYGMINLCEWAASGVETPMYPTPEDRAARSSGARPCPGPISSQDVHAGAEALTARLANLNEPIGARTVRLGSGAAVIAADLAATRGSARSRSTASTSPPSTSRSTGQNRSRSAPSASSPPSSAASRDVPARMLRSVDTGRCWEVGSAGPDLLGTEADLLAWLLGRAHGPLRTSDDSPLPVAPAWV